MRSPEPEIPQEPLGPPPFPTEVTPAQVAERAVLVDTPRGRLALIEHRPGDGEDPEILGVSAWCPHIDGPLWEGSAAGGEIACPWHRWRFSLSTGRCTWAPKGDEEEAAETEIEVYPTRTGPDGRIGILLGAS